MEGSRLFLYLCVLYGVYSAIYAKAYFNILSSKALDSFKRSTVPCMVHFAIHTEDELKQDREYQEFMLNFEEAGKYLSDFDVKSATVDCTKDPVEDFCSRDTIRDTLFVFRFGNILAELPMDALYSVDSIVSNMLHLVLLREVPFIQQPVELLSAQQRHKGRKDILFAKLNAVGLLEHRAFMEGAYAYSHLYQFIITTSVESNMLGQGEESEWKEAENRVWLFSCKAAAMTEPCHRSVYRGKLNVADFALYMKTLDLQPYIEYKGGVIFYQRVGIPTLYLCSDDEAYSRHKATVETLVLTYRGNLGFVLINCDTIPHTSLPVGLTCDRQHIFLQRSPQEVMIEMHKEMSLENIVAFVDDQMYIHDHESTYSDDEFPPPEETQDDEVEFAVYSDTRPVDTSHAITLTEKTFPDFISSRGLVMVLFTVHWDSRCKAFLESYSNAARFLQEDDSTTGRLAQLKCYSWPDVCLRHNVTTYPTVKMYKEGRLVTDYRGALSEKDVIKTYKLYSTTKPVVVGTCAECHALSHGQLPGWTSMHFDAVTIGYFPTGFTKDKIEYEHAADILQGQQLMAVCNQDCSDQRLKVTVYKWNDDHQGQVDYSGDYSWSSLVEFIQQAATPLVPELTPSSFPIYFGRGLPFLVLFKDTDGQSTLAADSIVRLVEEKTFKSKLTALWMDVSQPFSAGAKILRDYGIKRQVGHPSLVFVNHRTSHVCNYPPGYSLKAADVAEWLTIVLNGQTTCSDMRQDAFEPLLSPYDFLALSQAMHSGKVASRNRQLVSNHHHRKREDGFEDGFEDESQKEHHYRHVEL